MLSEDYEILKQNDETMSQKYEKGSKDFETIPQK